MTTISQEFLHFDSTYRVFPLKPQLLLFSFSLCLKQLLFSPVHPSLFPPSRRCYNTVQSQTNPFHHPFMVSLLCPHFFFFSLFFPSFLLPLIVPLEPGVDRKTVVEGKLASNRARERERGKERERSHAESEVAQRRCLMN